MNQKSLNMAAVIDVGSDKIVCLIGHKNDSGVVELLGVGHQVSRGFKNGIIVDISAAQSSILSAVSAAEEMAGFNVEDVVVSLSAAGLMNDNVNVELNIGGDEVNINDLAEMTKEAKIRVSNPENEIIHCTQYAYELDDMSGIRDPRYMVCDKMRSKIHIASMPHSKLKNLKACFAKCHLNIKSYVISSFASALSALDKDELDLGVIVIDLGSSSTDFSIFNQGKLTYSGAVKVGGSHITNDLAKGLSTSVANAERIKILHGSVFTAPNDDNILIEAPNLGDDSDVPNMIQKSIIVGIIKPRVEEIFELIKNELQSSGLMHNTGRRCVLVGGGSQLSGTRELASQFLNRQVRLGKPVSIPSMPDSLSNPSFCTPVGMLTYALNRKSEEIFIEEGKYISKNNSKVEKIIYWLKSNF